jgi:nitrous oxidase accessory protein NosD
MRTQSCVLLAGVTVAIGACGESVAGPAARERPAFAVQMVATCPTGANVVASDEAGLVAALSAASPGDVIGVDGMITVSADVIINVPDVTLTCARPGAGLAAHTGAGVFDVIKVLAERVTVDHLVLDGSQATDFAYAAYNDPDLPGSSARDVKFTNNRVTSSAGAFFDGATGIVADNYFEVAVCGAGIWLQGPFPRRIDGTRVERNTVVTTGPCTDPSITGNRGIRPRDGTNVVIADNIVLGPFNMSISPANLSRSVFEGNRIEGTPLFGIRFTINSQFPGQTTQMRDNVFRNNRVTGAGMAAIFARGACGNLFVGNSLQGNARDRGLTFDVLSGANTVVGNQNVVIDNGALDCNGDGILDPNVITGPGTVLRDARLGADVSEGIVMANRLR